MPVSQITFPAPRTWAANDLVTVPRLRADVSDAVAFLLQRPAFTGQQTGGPSWSSGADNALGLNAELNDPWNTHATGTQVTGAVSSQIFTPVPGWYLCRSCCGVNLPGSGASTYQTACGFGSTLGGVSQTVTRGGYCLNQSQSASQQQTLTAQCCDLVEQTSSGPVGGSGDWIQPTFFQSSGSPVNLFAAVPWLPTVSVRWVCATSGTQPLPVPPLTSVPTPITAAWLNANVRDAIRFLTYPPIVKATYVAGSSTLASAALTAPVTVPLNNVVVDNYAAYTTGASAKYTAPVAGIYYLYGQFNLANSAVGTNYGCGLSVNGGTAQYGDIVPFTPTASQAGGATVTRRLRLSANDTVQLVASQASGGAIALNTGAASATRFIAVWESS